MTEHSPNPVAMEIAADGRRRREAAQGRGMKMAETGHFIWEAFKHPDARCWGFRDGLGFAYLSTDRDGWATKHVVRLLNEAEAKEQQRLNPHLKLGSVCEAEDDLR